MAQNPDQAALISSQVQSAGAPTQPDISTASTNLDLQLVVENAATAEGNAATDAPTLTQEQLVRFVPKRFAAYIAHDGPSISDSAFVWYDASKNVAQFFRAGAEDTVDKTFLTSEGNDKGKTIVELLEGFCQKVDHPILMSEYTFMSTGIFLTALFNAYDGTKFKTEGLTWGVKGILTTGRNKRVIQLHKKFGDEPILLTAYGDSMKVHKDEGMIEQGLVTFSFIGEGNDDDFAFMIIVDIKDEEFEQYFSYPASGFEASLALACHDFHHASVYLKNPVNSAESAVLARQIGRGVFDRLTRSITMSEESAVAGEGEEKENSAVGEGTVTGAAVTADSPETAWTVLAAETLLPSSPPSSPRQAPKKKKKRSKKRKKAVATVSAALAEESDSEEDAIPSIIIQPPTPVPSPLPEATSTAPSMAPSSSRHLTVSEPSKTMPETRRDVIPVSSLSPSAPAFLPRPSSRLPSTTDTFSFTDPHTLFVCARPTCNNRTHATAASTSSSNTTVICPRCTPYNTTRYCCPEHLLDPPSLRSHFQSGNCGFGSMISGAVDDSPSSILPSSLPTRPYIHEDMSPVTNEYPKNIIERHRQSVWRSMAEKLSRTQRDDDDNNQGETGVDYWVFDDIDQIEKILGVGDEQVRTAHSVQKKAWLQQVRGLGHVCGRVRTDNLPADRATAILTAATTAAATAGNIMATPTASLLAPRATLKQRFDEALVRCMRLGFAAGTLRAGDCTFVYEVVKRCLDEQGVWDEWMRERVAVQMGFEFGWRCPDEASLA